MKKQDFTKEQLDAIKTVDNLYRLKADTEKAMEYLRQNRKNIPCFKKNNEIDGFSYALPSYLCDLVGMIKRGELIINVDAKIQ